MATLTTTRNMEDGEVLTRADFNAFLDDIETFLNTTKINDDNLQNSGITGSTKLLNQSVTAAKLATDSVETAKIAASAVTTAKIADENVTTAKIADSNVTTAKINDLAVTTAKINASAVTTAKIADDAVTAAKLADDGSVDANRAVTTNHIRDSAVTTAKINDAAVTPAKHSTNYATATCNGNTTASTAVDITIATLTTTGRPVAIVLYDGVLALTAGTGGRGAYAKVKRNDGGADVNVYSLYTAVSQAAAQEYYFNTSIDFGTYLTGIDGLGAIVILDTPAAGTWNYEFEIGRNSGGGGAITTLTDVKVLLYEI